MLIKLIHIASAIIGVGFSFAILIIRAKMAEHPGVIGPLMVRLSRYAFASLILLWITGIWMFSDVGAAGNGAIFALKMVSVVVLTAVAISMQYLMLKGPDHPFPVPRNVLSLSGNIAAALVVVFAVMTYS